MVYFKFWCILKSFHHATGSLPANDMKEDFLNITCNIVVIYLSDPYDPQVVLRPKDELLFVMIVQRNCIVETLYNWHVVISS